MIPSFDRNVFVYFRQKDEIFILARNMLTKILYTSKMETKLFFGHLVNKMPDLQEVVMDFKLSKAHLLQQELYRRFAENEIRPLAREMDESESYNMELLAKMKRYGFFGIPYARDRKSVV